MIARREPPPQTVRPLPQVRRDRSGADLHATAHEAVVWTENQMKEHPVAAIVSALALGLLAGWITKCRR
jgi:ElaB/YqjD/DUF883 family membrane-anchored ribosome-binding protein